MKLLMEFEFPEEPTGQQLEFVKNEFHKKAMEVGKLLWPDGSHSFTSSPNTEMRERKPCISPQQHKYREFSFVTKKDATTVLRVAKEILEQHRSVTVADVCDLVGLPSSNEDRHKGWTDLKNTVIVKDGKTWKLTFPPLKFIYPRPVTAKPSH